MAKTDDFKFCALVVCVKYWLWDDRYSLKWEWSQSCDLFKFW